MALGLNSEAQAAAAILQKDFSDNEWYADSLVLLSEQGLAAEGNSAGWLARIYRQTINGDWL